MALIDDPRAYILRLFQMEMREGREEFCQVYPEGWAISGAPLESNELVYGVYKSKYYFTPLAMLIGSNEGFERIPWGDVRACTTFHGCGEAWSVVTLLDGTEHRVRLSDLATGWSGRISQLMHKMIERWGASSFQGFPLMPYERFLVSLKDRYSFNPNLPDDLSLERISDLLEALHSRDDVEGLWIDLQDVEGDEPIAAGLVIMSPSPSRTFEDIAKHLGGEIVSPVSENLKRKIGPGVDEKSIIEIRWT